MTFVEILYEYGEGGWPIRVFFTSPRNALKKWRLWLTESDVMKFNLVEIYIHESDYTGQFSRRLSREYTSDFNRVMEKMKSDHLKKIQR